MAKIDINTLFRTLRGKIGDLVFRHMPDGSLVVSGRPRKRKKDSPAQKAHKSRFSEGSSFARWAQHEYPVYAELAAERPMITAYNMALSDFFHPPVIHRVLRKDGRILVHASDDIMVTGVKVTVSDDQGKPLEVGDAAQVEKAWWQYTPQAIGRVTASAWDIPGNRACLELE